MKLTKTQILLVQEAATNPFLRMVAESYCGTGADGGRIRGGDRRANAARGQIKVPCGKCGGAGRIDCYSHVDGGVCFKCYGVNRWTHETVNLYTAGKLASLRASAMRRQEKAIAKAQAEQAAHLAEVESRRAAFMADHGHLVAWLNIAGRTIAPVDCEGEGPPPQRRHHQPGVTLMTTQAALDYAALESHHDAWSAASRALSALSGGGPMDLTPEYQAALATERVTHRAYLTIHQCMPARRLNAARSYGAKQRQAARLAPLQELRS